MQEMYGPIDSIQFLIKVSVVLLGHSVLQMFFLSEFVFQKILQFNYLLKILFLVIKEIMVDWEDFQIELGNMQLIMGWFFLIVFLGYLEIHKFLHDPQHEQDLDLLLNIFEKKDQ